MPRPIRAVRVSVDLLREIDRLLACAELMPAIGTDAGAARETLRAIDPSVFGDDPRYD